MNCLNIAGGLRVRARFLKTVKFSDLVDSWKKPKPVRAISFFIRLNVICSNYGFRCKSEDFYDKENWKEFEQLLLQEGWKVLEEDIFCPSCYCKEVDG